MLPKAYYSPGYRIFKTILFMFAYISLGVNNEIFSVVFEDLKILFNINYKQMASMMIAKSVGFVICLAIVGLILERFIKYSDIFICVSTFVISLAGLLIPSTNIYWLAIAMYFIQGCAQSFFDNCANVDTLRMWNGISHSPISIIHAGYGIGALMAVFTAKPFVKYNRILNVVNSKSNILNGSIISIQNLSTITHQSDIRLQIPYTISSIFGFIVALAFLATYYYELKVLKINKTGEHNETDFSENKENPDQALTEKLSGFEKIFGEKFENKRKIFEKSIKVVLLFMICISIGGYNTLIQNYTLTYFTKGPAKLPIDTYFYLQMLFWIFFAISRLLTTLIAFKMNPLIFVSGLIILNLIFLILYCLPILNSISYLYWFFIISIASLAGPHLPAGLMMAKYVLKNINSFLFSIFALGFTFGAIGYEFLTGYLLDEFKPNPNWFGYKNAIYVYIIPYILLSAITISALFFILLIISYKFCTKRIVIDPHIW